MRNIQNNDLKTIGIFNDSFPPIMDGVSLTTENYAYWLHKKNQPVCVVTPKAPHCSRYPKPFPVYLYTSIPIIGRKPYRFGLPDMDPLFQRKIDRIQFGLVHAHCPFSSGILALRIAKEQKIPLVATFHSKYRDDFQRSLHNKRVANLMIKEVIRFYEKADEVWIPQASVEETIREYGFKGKVEVVNNGNDFSNNEPVEPLKKTAREYLGVSENEMVLLFVGNIFGKKTPD
jgi:glycosyltransferase involved in cell wall biosynthesis